MSDATESILWSKGYRINSRGEWYKPTHPVSDIPQPAEHKPDSGHDSLGKNPGTDDGPGFRVVRITSYRVRLLDERNIFEKYLVDALVKASLLRNDSPEWCRVEVKQVKVETPELERTEIEITDSESNPQP